MPLSTRLLRMTYPAASICMLLLAFSGPWHPSGLPSIQPAAALAAPKPAQSVTLRMAAADSADNGSTPNDIIARRITVQGAVQGGYYRSCVQNEGGRFRRLVGTMSPPDENSDEAEIYVEGKKKMVEGFVRWCKKGDVGLSQSSKVTQVIEEEPTGLYDEFYVKTQ